MIEKVGTEVEALAKYCELAECSPDEALEVFKSFLQVLEPFELEYELATEILHRWVLNILPIATRVNGKESRKLSRILLVEMLTHDNDRGALTTQRALFDIQLVQKFFVEALWAIPQEAAA